MLLFQCFFTVFNLFVYYLTLPVKKQAKTSFEKQFFTSFLQWFCSDSAVAKQALLVSCGLGMPALVRAAGRGRACCKWSPVAVTSEQDSPASPVASGRGRLDWRNDSNLYRSSSGRDTWWWDTSAWDVVLVWGRGCTGKLTAFSDRWVGGWVDGCCEALWTNLASKGFHASVGLLKLLHFGLVFEFLAEAAFFGSAVFKLCIDRHRCNTVFFPGMFLSTWRRGFGTDLYFRNVYFCGSGALRSRASEMVIVTAQFAARTSWGSSWRCIDSEFVLGRSKDHKCKSQQVVDNHDGNGWE